MKCPLPWKHFATDPEQSVRPCCRFIVNDRTFPTIGEKPALEVINDWELRRVRALMLAGKNVDGCKKCSDLEKIGGKSFRLTAIQEYGLDGTDSEFVQLEQIRYIEFALGNFCNLKCRICSSRFSSAWHGDEMRMGGPPRDTRPFRARVESIRPFLPHLERIKVLGGEPMLSQEHDELLEEIASHGSPAQMTMQYNSNGTRFPQPKILKQWAGFKQIRMFVSIDGVGDLNRYLRHGSNWEALLDTLRRYQEYGLRHENFVLGITTAISAYNCAELPNICAWWKSFSAGTAERLAEMSIIPVFEPEFLGINILPLEYRARLIERYEGSSSPRLQRASVHLRQGDETWRIPDFLKYTRDLDLLRGENFSAVLPDLECVLKNHMQKNLCPAPPRTDAGAGTLRINSSAVRH